MEKSEFTEGQEHEFKQLLCKWQNVRNKIYQIENAPFKQQIRDHLLHKINIFAANRSFYERN